MDRDELVGPRPGVERAPSAHPASSVTASPRRGSPPGSIRGALSFQQRKVLDAVVCLSPFQAAVEVSRCGHFPLTGVVIPGVRVPSRAVWQGRLGTGRPRLALPPTAVCPAVPPGSGACAFPSCCCLEPRQCGIWQDRGSSARFLPGPFRPRPPSLPAWGGVSDPTSGSTICSGDSQNPEKLFCSAPWIRAEGPTMTPAKDRRVGPRSRQARGAAWVALPSQQPWAGGGSRAVCPGVARAGRAGSEGLCEWPWPRGLRDPPPSSVQPVWHGPGPRPDQLFMARRTVGSHWSARSRVSGRERDAWQVGSSQGRGHLPGQGQGSVLSPAAEGPL